MQTFYTQRNNSYVLRAGADATLALSWRGGWDSTPAPAVATLGFALLPYKAGGTSVLQVTLATAGAPQPYRIAFRRWVSEPLLAGTGAGTMNMCLGVSENSADANYFTKVYAYMTVGDTDVVRCVLVDYEGDVGTDTEWPTTGTFWDIDTPPALNANSWQEGDRLVIEFGGIARNTLGAARTGNLWVGNRASDGVVGGTDVATKAGRVTFSSDLFTRKPSALVPGDIVIGNGDVAAYDGVTGALKGVFYIPNVSTGSAAGAYTDDGHVWVTVEGQRQIHKLDLDLELVETHFTASTPRLPHFISFADDGSYWLGHTGDTSNGPCINSEGSSPATAGQGSLLHMSAVGVAIEEVDPTKEDSGTPSGDLHADQVTMAYGSLGRTIFRVNIATAIQLADFATLAGSTPTNTVRGMKWLTDGGLIVADAADIKRLSSAGAVVQQYTDTDQADWGTVSLGPTGTDYFWAANTGQNVGGLGVPLIAKFDFDGTVLMRIRTPTSSDLTGVANSQLCSGGIVVVGGWRASTSPAPEPEPEPEPLPGEGQSPCEAPRTGCWGEHVAPSFACAEPHSVIKASAIDPAMQIPPTVSTSEADE